MTIGSGRGMQYGAALPDGRVLVIVYDTRGQARSAGILQDETPVIGCGPRVGIGYAGPDWATSPSAPASPRRTFPCRASG